MNKLIKTRKRVILIYGSSAIILFVFVILTTGNFFSKSAYNKTEVDKYKLQCKTIPYDILSKKKEQYMNSKVVFSGRIIQVNGHGTNVVLGVNVTKLDNGTYKDKIWVNYTYTFDEKRIQENDIVNIWGEVKGIESREVVLRHQMIFPEINAKVIEITGKAK